jgi:glutamate--cysteine ligase
LFYSNPRSTFPIDVQIIVAVARLRGRRGEWERSRGGRNADSLLRPASAKVRRPDVPARAVSLTMTEFLQSPGQAEDITHRSQLHAYFDRAGKPREAWRVGTEHEKLGVDARTAAAVPYSGPHGIEAFLGTLAERYGWEAKREDGHIIALYRDRASVTLEPGGQLELSGEQCPTIHCAAQEFARHTEEIVSVGSEMGIVFLGLGIHPVSAVDEIEMVPKQRYRIMAPYMATVGTLGLRMMKQTATVQANFDFADEADAMAKLRTSMGLVPILSAMFSNSSISEGDLNGLMTLRGHIWTDTDRARAGLLPFVFSESAGFDAYIDWALDAPMYFVIRDGKYVDLTGTPFRAFVEHGRGDLHATMDDWALHLTTLFPEVRLKTYLEVRSVDSQPPQLVLAVPALLKGVLYEQDCLDGAWDLVKRWTWSERLELYADAHRLGLEARAGRTRMLDLAAELTVIAAEGLKRQAALDGEGRDEAIYLDPLRAQLGTGASPARYVADRWGSPWNRDFKHLIAFAGYRVGESPPP